MTSAVNLKNPKLYEEAVTHRSYLNENKIAEKHNERLEFLGDAVLELAVSEYLFNRFPDKPEGDLTAYRAALVRTTTLAALAKALGLGDQLKMSKGEELSGGRSNPSLLANTFEAVIGAMYLSDGFPKVQKFLSDNLFPQLDSIIKNRLFKDYKSSLQELVQSQGSPSPEYTVTNETGPDHNKQFSVVAVINGKEMAEGQGRSKQAAQQEAARIALEKYHKS
jgi:ribonuclease III